ncbi:MAG: SIR2 family NAD-dependent protein deacylase [Iamia sp.]
MSDEAVPRSTEEREGIEHGAWLAGEEVALDEAVAEVSGWLAESQAVVALTGAGVSTDSGIPDFRGKNGVWTRDPGAEKASTIQHYLSSPEVRRTAWQIRLTSPAWRAEPNAGHRALVALEPQGRLDTLVTQNTDGLHLLAGTSPDRLVEVHGSMRGVMCVDCDDRADMRLALARVEAGEVDPPCRSCGGILKATTILFGESLIEADIAAAQAAAERCDLVLAVGTTLNVFPAAHVPRIAQRAGAKLVIVNGGPTDADGRADAVLRGSISEILPALVAEEPVR